jgi:hypothetical protein
MQLLNRSTPPLLVFQNWHAPGRNMSAFNAGLDSHRQSLHSSSPRMIASGAELHFIVSRTHSVA